MLAILRFGLPLSGVPQYFSLDLGSSLVITAAAPWFQPVVPETVAKS